jgi:RNA polymerase sigma-70 factor (ECF subfamily)
VALVASSGRPYDDRTIGRPGGKHEPGDGASGRACLFPLAATAGVSVTSPPEPRSVLSAEDRGLLDACLAGTAGAWDTFVGRFARLFAFIASKSARQRGLALAAADRDDLVADILVECLRNDAAALRSFAGRSSLATYLAVIARRVVVRRLADAAREAAPRVPQPRHRRADVMAGDETAQAADREQVETLLRGLDTDEARLVRLHHLEHRSYGEISHLTGMPLNSIGPALSRAREKMKRLEHQPRAG